jgi:hypothetical protein
LTASASSASRATNGKLATKQLRAPAAKPGLLVLTTFGTADKGSRPSLNGQSRGRSLGFISFGPTRALPAYDPLGHVQRLSITGVFTGGVISRLPSGLEDASRATILLRLFLVARRCTLARLAFFAFIGFDFLAFARLVAFLATRAFRKLVLALLVAFVALAGLAFRRFALTRLAFFLFAMSRLPLKTTNHRHRHSIRASDRRQRLTGPNG